MAELALPLITLVAAIALTYLFCVRPMRRRGHGCGGHHSNDQVDNEIAVLRRELDALREQSPQHD